MLLQFYQVPAHASFFNFIGFIKTYTVAKVKVMRVNLIRTKKKTKAHFKQRVRMLQFVDSYIYAMKTPEFRVATGTLHEVTDPANQRHFLRTEEFANSVGKDWKRFAV